MEIVYLIVGLTLGLGTGFLIAERKKQIIQAKLFAADKEIDLLKKENVNIQQRFDKETSQMEIRLKEERTQIQQHLKEEREQMQLKMKEERAQMQLQMKLEFENLSNRIFECKTQKLNDLQNEKLNDLLRPLSENLKDFHHKVEEVYDKESKERFSLEKQIKELVELNQHISEDANNLTKALKGDSKMQGNWGEAILERLLQISGLTEGEHYKRQVFITDEMGNKLINEDSGKEMQPDIILYYPGNREMIIDSKVSLTAYTAYTATEDREQQNKLIKEHLVSVRRHIDELSVKDYSRYDCKAPDFVMMFIPTEGAYLAAINADNTLWEYAYNKKVVLMSPTNLITALRLSLDLWRRENQVKNVQEIIRKGTSLYEKIAGFTETFVTLKDNLNTLHNNFEKAEKQLSTGKGNVIRQAQQLSKMDITPKKKIASQILVNAELEDEE